jgi:hypothetical protein
MTAEDEVFLQQILEERDRLFRETSRLESELANFENFGSERASYQQLLGYCGRFGANPVNDLSMRIRSKDASILKDLTCFRKKKNLPPVPNRR